MPDLDIWKQLVATFGTMSILAWYCWYVTSKALPKMVDKFADEEKTARTDFRAEQASTRQHYEAVVDKVLDEHREATNKLALSVETMVKECSLKQRIS